MSIAAQDRMKAMAPADIAIGGGALVFIIATFFPWYSYSYTGFGSTSYSGWGTFWGILAFLVAVAVLALLATRMFAPQVGLPTLPLGDGMLFLIAGAVMVVLTLLALLAHPGSGLSLDVPGYSSGVAWGWFVAIVAALAVAAGGFLRRADAPVPGVARAAGGGGTTAPYGGQSLPPAGYPTTPQQGGYAPPPADPGYAPPPADPGYAPPQGHPGSHPTPPADPGYTPPSAP